MRTSGIEREWAAARAPYGIRVAAVVTAGAMTPFFARWLETFEDPDIAKAHITKHMPSGRRIHEFAELATQLALGQKWRRSF